MSEKVRILTLDGGGIRGIIPAKVLKYVEEKLIEITGNKNTRIADHFDFIAGTSTGGILTCFYLTPNPEKGLDKPNAKFTATHVLELYTEKGSEIFNRSKKYGWLGMRQLFNATKFHPSNMEKILNEEFGEIKMSELLRPCIVTTYNMETRSSFFFSSRERKEKKREFFVKDVVRSTSAAPTYFPPAMISNQVTGEIMINIDGAVFANNPAMCAYAECRKIIFPHIQRPDAKDMLILSIGTGAGQLSLPDVKKSDNWGVISWAKSAPEIMMDGSVDTVDYQMENLFKTLNDEFNEKNKNPKPEFKSNYKRIDVPAEKRNYSPDISDASNENINALHIAGEETLKDALSKKNNEYTLDEFIELLVKNA